jgi:predicted 5'-methylthioadenosine/S-adenosylhomocysteine nucleosidase
MMNELLLVAATELELCDRDGLVCGIGPVEAAVATAARLAEDRPGAVLHVGVAGGRRLTPGTLVFGTEAAYLDLAAGIPVVDRVEPDPRLLAALRAAFPDTVALPIATSAAVRSGPAEHDFRVEAMEGFGVLRACQLAGVPAVEVRAISNDIGEGDRERWMIQRGLEVLGTAMPRLLEALSQ